MFDNLLNSFSRQKISSDRITVIAAKAKEYKKKYGNDNTIDGTIGMFYDEDEKLYIFETIKKIFQNIDYRDVFSYSPMVSNKNFFDGIMNLTSLNELDNFNKIFSCAPVSGGLGAIHHSVHNFCDEETLIIALYPFWGPYQNVMEEIGLKMNYICPFDIGEKEINFDNIRKNIKDKLIKNNYKKIFFLLNTPASNPTGLSLNDKELLELYKIFNEIKLNNTNFNSNSNEKLKIILFLDLAYIDFTDFKVKDLIKFFISQKNENKKIIEDESKSNIINKNKDENYIIDNPFDTILMGYSLSKSCGLYGLRTGACILYSQKEEDHKIFEEKYSFSSRASTGSINHLGYYIVEKFSDPQYIINLKEEQKNLKKKLYLRRENLLKVLNNLGYVYYRHDDGFFVTYKKSKDQNKFDIEKYYEDLEKKGVFFVPSIDGLRIAICSIPNHKIDMLKNII
ncbi:MAG: aminotransferase class I/II-fold pyridoxal phosphate-dependent enzyme [Spirochaetes bacterium]|nr:aminotransferase class I/II-fold pyridoxal phosphate-dependent enzyme [Spirochaetota bacterium]